MTSAGRRALFLDRDGVINVEKNYVHRIEDFEFLPGIFELCATARELGYLIVVITNQAGIGRGYYTEAAFQRLTEWMLGAFRARGIDIARVYHCPYHPTAGVGEYKRESFDRKPNPGMIFKAKHELGLDLAQCVLIGDKDSDVEAGRAAGVGLLCKLAHTADLASCATTDVHICQDLAVARLWLVRHSQQNLPCA
ncbi:MAG: D-glycero-alpha-D-manno-heptose-1,7-bisphosphate 7-phosphatase [Thiobacillaceae bacterium]